MDRERGHNTLRAMNELCAKEPAEAPAQSDRKSAPWEMRKRSVVIAGHRTSVSLENAFWDELKTIAGARGNTVNQIVTEIDGQRSGNLSSAIRLYVLTALQAS
jgi:predicted DNA-binding ribbon-helix-helix protein